MSCSYETEWCKNHAHCEQCVNYESYEPTVGNRMLKANEMNNDCICPATRCSKRDKCKYYEGNYWTWNDNLKWAQVEDWSVQGSVNCYNDRDTGELIIEETHWCGDSSEYYPYFERYK